MRTWVGQYCIYVSDLEASVAFYEGLGLTATSRTDLGHTLEAIVEHPGKGGKLQLAQRVQDPVRIEMGNAFWKLYVGTTDVSELHTTAVAGGATSVMAPFSPGEWPVTIAFLADPDGYQVELMQRHPWQDGDETTRSWLGQYCIYVSDLEASVAAYEALGLTCTSRTEIPDHLEAILEQPGAGGKLQLAQQTTEPKPIDMGTAMWKLYLTTDDCAALHDAAVAAGLTSTMAPMRLEQWPVTVAFLTDRDGYTVELVQRHED